MPISKSWNPTFVSPQELVKETILSQEEAQELSSICQFEIRDDGANTREVEIVSPHVAKNHDLSIQHRSIEGKRSMEEAVKEKRNINPGGEAIGAL